MMMIGFSETEIERLIVLLKKSVKRNQMNITRLNPNGDAPQACLFEKRYERKK